MTPRPPIRQRAETIQPVRRPIPAQLSPRTPSRLRPRALRIRRAPLHPHRVRRSVGRDEPTTRLTSTRINSQRPPRIGTSQQTTNTIHTTEIRHRNSRHTTTEAPSQQRKTRPGARAQPVSWGRRAAAPNEASEVCADRTPNNAPRAPAVDRRLAYNPGTRASVVGLTAG